jgi:hypothetical protein
LSKGRPRCHTSWSLSHIGVPHFVVVEKEDEPAYRAALPPLSTILVLPESNQGVVYVRNWIWDHARAALAAGDDNASYHWQLDDDITCFSRLQRNTKIPVASGTIFQLAEAYVDRFDNIGQAGFQMAVFIPRKSAIKYPPVYLNTRVYSCTMNRTSLDFRYRGPLNDDTDMSLRILKDGWCTIVFNAFLHEIMTTMVQKGGMTDLYEEKMDSGANLGRLKMARRLVELHPDVTQIYFRWGRWQHLVDYRPFKANKLKLREGFEPPHGFDEHGLVLEHLENGRWVRGVDLPENVVGA